MRTLFIAVALLAFWPAASACDVCGCSIGGNYFGILPQFHRHFIGLRWSAETSYTALNTNDLLQGRYHSIEEFQSLDVVGRFYPARRWQLLALAPYHWNRQTEGGVPTSTRGLGDVSVLANYVLLDTGDSLRHRWRQTLSFGGGVKLPTGRHDLPASNGESLNPSLQPGTGSTDFMFSAAYTLRRGAWGASADLLARWNTANRQHFRFGNRVSGSAKVFYWKNIRGITLLPNTGIFSDAARANRDDGLLLKESKGLTSFATLGLDTYVRHFSAGLSYQIPVWQSRPTVQANARWMLTVNYIF